MGLGRMALILEAVSVRARGTYQEQTSTLTAQPRQMVRGSVQVFARVRPSKQQAEERLGPHSQGRQ